MTEALPDAEALCEALLGQLKPAIAADVGVVGIVTGGAWLAERLHAALRCTTPLGTLDPSFYRDDFAQTGLKHAVHPSRIPFQVQGRHLLLVDDVLYTGRTVRNAMNELFDYGRPASISLAALVDRGGRELPIAAQYLGATVAVPLGKTLVLQRDALGTLSLQLSDSRRVRTAPR